MKQTVLFLIAFLMPLCMSAAKTIYRYNLLITSTEPTNEKPYFFPNAENYYSFKIVLNPTPSGSEKGNFKVALEYGKFSNASDTITVNEGLPFTVVFDDVTNAFGVVKITAATAVLSTDSLVGGDSIVVSAKIASLKGLTPNVIVFPNANPPMGNTQPITAQLLDDMVYPGILVAAPLGGMTDKKVEDYEWTLPSGWKTSKNQTGTFLLSAAESKTGISIIPDNLTPGELKVRAVNSLNPPTAGSEYKTFTMDRGFALTSYPASITYGDKTVRTFSVTSFSGLTYEWSAPAGWQINGQGATLQGVNLNSVSITPKFCNISPSDKVKVRLKVNNEVSQWLEFPTQITTPDINVMTFDIYQYEVATVAFQNIVSGEIQSVDFSNNVLYIGNTGSNYKILPLVAGNITFHANILLNGCTTPITVSKQIAVNPSRIAISGLASVCPGSSEIFTVSYAPAGFTWTCGPSLSLSSVSGNSATFYAYTNNSTWVTIKYDQTELARKNVTIGNASVSITGAAVVPNNSSEQYYPSLQCPPATATYYWQLKDQSNQQIIGTATTTESRPYVILKPTLASYKSAYVLKLTYENFTCEKSVTILNGTLELIALQIAFTILPNPASSEVFIEITDNAKDLANAMSATSKAYSVHIVDLYGAVVYTGQTKENNFSLSTASFRDGIYSITISDGISSQEKKLVVKH